MSALQAIANSWNKSGQRIIKHDDEDNVYKVHGEENAKQDPGGLAGEEERVAAAGMLEEEAEGFFHRRAFRAELEDGPDDEPQETWVEGVAGVGEEAHDDQWERCVLEANHRVRSEGEPEVANHRLCGIEAPVAWKG